MGQNLLIPVAIFNAPKLTMVFEELIIPIPNRENPKVRRI